jgi:DNA topoisomerase VI subunit B
VADRTTFTTSRLLDFFSEKELVAQTGHATTQWPVVVVKELIDNALDACEETNIAPKIKIIVDDVGITVIDNGPGIPAETVTSVLDYSVRVSSREAYVAPDRGAQGNALKTIVAMPFVLDGSVGRLTVTARGVRHEIQVAVDPIRQVPVITHDQQVTDVNIGTRVTVHWPDSATLDSRRGQVAVFTNRLPLHLGEPAPEAGCRLARRAVALVPHRSGLDQVAAVGTDQPALVRARAPRAPRRRPRHS